MLLDLMFHHDLWWQRAQGVTPSNIKFTPVRDGYVVKTTTSASSGLLQKKASGAAAFKPSILGAHTDCSGFLRGEANAFARATTHGVFCYVEASYGSGDSGAGSYTFGAGSGFSSVAVSADATGIAWGGWAADSGISYGRALGVKNPTDEEVATMIYLLSKKRLT